MSGAPIDKSERPAIGPALSDETKKQRFEQIEKGIHIGPKQLNEIFALFGEPESITLLRLGDVYLNYPLGRLCVHCSSLIKESEERRMPGGTELNEPWAFHSKDEWEQFDHGVIIGHFGLDRVPGSDFNQIVVQQIYGTFPPKIIHDRFDMLSEGVKAEIIAKLIPMTPTPEKSAQLHWQEIQRDRLVEKWRSKLVELQIIGEPTWRSGKLFIGNRQIEFDHYDEEILGLEPRAAVDELIEKNRRILTHFTDPLEDSFVPKNDEPLLGIPSVEDWRAKYASAFNKLKESANWDVQDAARVRHLNTSISAPSIKIISFIDLNQQSRGRGHTRSPTVARTPSHPPKRVPAIIAPPVQRKLRKREVDEHGWFTCDKGHKNKLGSYGMDRLKNLKPDEQIKLKCDGCNCCVGYSEKPWWA